MTKKNLIHLTVTCLLVVGSFALGRYWTGIGSAFRDMSCVAYSDASLRQKLDNRFHPPENAFRLYYARCGFQDTSFFAAFSAPANDCFAYLSSLGISLDEMQSSTIIPDWIIEQSPKHYRPDLDHKNWDLKPGTTYSNHINNDWFTFYDRNINRIYIAIQGH